ncbi:universal stress protein [Planosporangium mesophilum]|uniref:Universal stress protein n=1 Tax=Planosporangium mesophilum TaxID=689768 RepID=A0A8J3TH94_9ACTN|nr:universal stress protein [Planosporangium mesophilum]NJC85654.1 universal stress protein [Planosporangium mesophilum]GII21450.1 universal stress protein [Planosporangium mesophilum]
MNDRPWTAGYGARPPRIGAAAGADLDGRRGPWVTTRIVVGVDGSPPSEAALCWAAREAERRRAELVVLVVYNWRTSTVQIQVSHEFGEYVRDLAMSIMEAAVAEARTVAPHAHVHGAAVFGEPVRVLSEAGNDAEMLVVGGRGSGGFARLLAGSVSVQLAARMPVPVTVVRGRDDDCDETDPVVVGVDGSASADAATGLAFEEAAQRGCRLVAGFAYDVSTPPWTAGAPAAEYDTGRIQDELRAALVGHVARWHDKYPDVPVDYVVDQGSPAAVLTRWSRHAQLLVVGCHGHGATTGALPGAVWLQLIHHADCPVLIARSPENA